MTRIEFWSSLAVILIDNVCIYIRILPICNIYPLFESVSILTRNILTSRFLLLILRLHIRLFCKIFEVTLFNYSIYTYSILNVLVLFLSIFRFVFVFRDPLTLILFETKLDNNRFAVIIMIMTFSCVSYFLHTYYLQVFTIFTMVHLQRSVLEPIIL